jgi:hypothetical protein
MVARSAKHNVPSKKAIASVLSLIFTTFWTYYSLICMNDFAIYAFLAVLSNPEQNFFKGVAGQTEFQPIPLCYYL